eukprot:6191809-Pleurochrysis_carterae.AAC.2
MDIGVFIIAALCHFVWMVTHVKRDGQASNLGIPDQLFMCIRVSSKMNDLSGQIKDHWLLRNASGAFTGATGNASGTITDE